MNGRIYDPLLGRFLSADLVVQNPGNLQCFNRYSYVMNNPLRYTDPTGFETEEERKKREEEEAQKSKEHTERLEKEKIKEGDPARVQQDGRQAAQNYKPLTSREKQQIFKELRAKLLAEIKARHPNVQGMSAEGKKYLNERLSELKRRIDVYASAYDAALEKVGADATHSDLNQAFAETLRDSKEKWAQDVGKQMLAGYSQNKPNDAWDAGVSRDGKQFNTALQKSDDYFGDFATLAVKGYANQQLHDGIVHQRFLAFMKASAPNEGTYGQWMSGPGSAAIWRDEERRGQGAAAEFIQYLIDKNK